MNQFDIVCGVFNPVNISSVRQEMIGLIGKSLTLTASFIIDRGPFSWQFAMTPDPCHGVYFWIPEQDIEITDHAS